MTRKIAPVVLERMHIYQASVRVYYKNGDNDIEYYFVLAKSPGEAVGIAEAFGKRGGNDCGIFGPLPKQVDNRADGIVLDRSYLLRMLKQRNPKKASR